MSKFTPTKAEKATLSYLDWDDAALGRFTKHVACTLAKVQGDSDGLHRVTAASCAMMLVGTAFDANAGTLDLKLSEHTHKGEQTGDWRIIVIRASSHDQPQGPLGYLIKPKGLNEEHWHLSDDPSLSSEDESIPLFANAGRTEESPAT